MTPADTEAQKVPAPNRQLIVCCDGTNNNVTGGRTDTNVIKLQQVLLHDANQLVFYDPGVGNPDLLPGATVFDRVRLKLDRIAGLAFGAGVYENVAECYVFLMRNYLPGNEIYLFGFSRGAFTARALSGVVNMFGLLRPELDNMVPTLLHLYFSRRETEIQKADVNREADEIKRLFVSPEHRDVWIHFIGVWDTVASIGVPPFDKQITTSPTVVGKKFRHVRQALALDEYRAPFLPRLYADPDFHISASDGKPEQSLRQSWFHGVHCDVGGGYDPYDNGPQCGCGLSDFTLHWLLNHARDCGLRATGLQLPPTLTRVHSELYNQALWALAGMVQRDLKPGEGRSDVIDFSRPVPGLPGHAPVDLPALRFPQDTVWAIARPWKPLLVALAGFIAAIVVMYCLMRTPGKGMALVLWQFIHWQAILQFSLVDNLAAAMPQLKTALMFWLVGQGAMLFVVARMSSWAFAQVAGLRERDLPPSVLLNRLGSAPRWFTVFAVGATLAGVGSLLIAPWAWQWLSAGLRLLMNVAWWLQGPALLGILALALWGTWTQLRR